MRHKAEMQAENDRLRSWLTDANKALVFADGLCVSLTGRGLAGFYAEDCEWAQNALARADCHPRGRFDSVNQP